MVPLTQTMTQAYVSKTATKAKITRSTILWTPALEIFGRREKSMSKQDEFQSVIAKNLSYLLCEDIKQLSESEILWACLEGATPN